MQGFVSIMIFQEIVTGNPRAKVGLEVLHNTRYDHGSVSWWGNPLSLAVRVKRLPNPKRKLC